MKLQTLLAFTTAAFAGLGSAQQWRGTYHINDINPDLKVVCNVGTPQEGKDNSCLVDGLKQAILSTYDEIQNGRPSGNIYFTVPNKAYAISLHYEKPADVKAVRPSDEDARKVAADILSHDPPSPRRGCASVLLDDVVQLDMSLALSTERFIMEDRNLKPCRG
ncbi:hypothetical protein TRICI_000984 [Trichomonascus ciferrii]|uniref:Uncharacterized protein n=1 Tax=Trichomonascus ciferrii TaxID=44093 RepID=A0A642VCP2_9ASCO|nr:hypothetical protein TRICI_000984 [Trichomonascus ciferrii]